MNNLLEIAFFAISLIFCEIFINVSKYAEINKASSFFRKVCRINFGGLAIALCMGFVFSSYFGNIRLKEVCQYDNNSGVLIGTIMEEGIYKGDYWQYILKNNRINGDKIKSNVLVRSKSKLNFGDRIEAIANFKLPTKIRNSGGYDYSKYLKTLNVYITAEIQDASVLQELNVNFVVKASYIIRSKVKEFSNNHLASDKEGILNALIIGDESKISSKIEEQYKKAGMIHLLVVSGGHTVFLIMLLERLFKLFNVSKKSSKYISIIVIILYIFITGATPSIVRAGIACIIVKISEIIGRENDGYTTLFLVLLLILIKNPFYIYSLSLQLSFLGVLGIMMLYTKIKQRLLFLPNFIADSLTLTTSAFLFVTPITIYNFNTMYLSGFISNIITLPLSGGIMMAGMVLFIISFIIPFIVPFFMKIVSGSIYLMNFLSEFFANMEFFSYYIITPSKVSIVFYYILVLYVFREKKDTSVLQEKSLILYKRKLVKVRKETISIVLIVIVIIFSLIKINIGKDLEISVIDVGHGDSILIETPCGKNILVDTGDYYTRGDTVYDSGERTVAPYLLDKGIKIVDLLILTHFDSDHIGGYKSIVDVIDVKTLGISVNSTKKEKYKEIIDIAKKKNTKVKSVERGDTYTFGDVVIKILLPQKADKIENENNDSIVFLIEYENKKALFMGDLEKEGEEVLMSLEKDLEVDILKVGHHGSITSSSEEFIERTSPKIALISVGNRFSSVPGKEVLKRFSSIYTKVYRTDKNGEIKVKMGEDTIKIGTIY